MNTIHDMGGMDGFGPIEPEENEPVFHQRWEGRVYALMRAVGPWGRGREWPSFRFTLETIPPVEYLSLSYYERWFRMMTTRLLVSGLISETETGDGLSGSGGAPAGDAPGVEQRCAGSRTPRHGRIRPLRTERPGTRAQPPPARPHPAAALRARESGNGRRGSRRLRAAGHRRGRAASPRPPRPQHVYSVRFEAQELWGERAAAGDTVYVDLWEDYLEPA